MCKAMSESLARALPAGAAVPLRLPHLDSTAHCRRLATQSEFWFEFEEMRRVPLCPDFPHSSWER